MNFQNFETFKILWHGASVYVGRDDFILAAKCWSTAQHEVYTSTTARGLTLSGVCHVMLTRLFTRTPLVKIRSSPIGPNNEIRDWIK